MRELTSIVPVTFQNYRPGSTIVAIRGYQDRHGGVSDHALAFHVSYEKMLQKSVVRLQGLEGQLTGLAEEARNELIESYVDSLRGHNPRATSAHAYTEVCDSEGNVIPGVKLHKDSGELHLSGSGIWKRIIVPGVYPEVKSRPKTIEKNKLRAMLPISRWRQFRLTRENFLSIAIEGHVFGPEDCP